MNQTIKTTTKKAPVSRRKSAYARARKPENKAALKALAGFAALMNMMDASDKGNDCSCKDCSPTFIAATILGADFIKEIDDSFFYKIKVDCGENGIKSSIIRTTIRYKLEALLNKQVPVKLCDIDFTEIWLGTIREFGIACKTNREGKSHIIFMQTSMPNGTTIHIQELFSESDSEEFDEAEEIF